MDLSSAEKAIKFLYIRKHLKEWKDDSVETYLDVNNIDVNHANIKELSVNWSKSWKGEWNPGTYIKYITLLLNQEPWEYAAFAVLLIKQSLSTISVDKVLFDFAIECIDKMMEHAEARVRLLVASIFKSLYLSKLVDNSMSKQEIFQLCYGMIVKHVKPAYERSVSTRVAVLGEEETLPLDDTTGWTSLETSFVALRELLDAGNMPGELSLFLQNIVPLEVYDIFLSQAAVHINRYIRQSAMEFIPIVVKGFENVEIPSEIVERFVQSITCGMKDSWCQVRLPAVMAAEIFLNHTDIDSLQSYWNEFIPPLCLNRHYMTDSVKEHALAAWTGGVSKGSREKGQQIVISTLPQLTSFYISMTTHKSHLVCEAACHAIAELGVRIDKASVEEYLPSLYQALLSCLEDESWPIRDACNIAMPPFLVSNMKHFNSNDVVAEAWCSRYDETLPILLRHLEDAFKPVRLSSIQAVSSFIELGNLKHIQTGTLLGLDVITKMINFIDSHLYDVRLEEYAGKKNIQFIPDTMLQAMLTRTSTGESELQSLPKYRRRTGGWGCCLDCSPSDKARRPWEITEIVVNMLKAIAISEHYAEYQHVICLQHHIQQIWEVIVIEGFKDSDKFQTALLDQLTAIYIKFPEFLSALDEAQKEFLARCTKEAKLRLRKIAAEKLIKLIMP